MVSTFPSVTHVAFASLFGPLGTAPSPRYELRSFDTTENATIGGGPLHYADERPPWSSYLDAPGQSLVREMANYVSPPLTARLSFRAIERDVLSSPKDVVVSYIGATDGLLHLYTDERATQFLVELDRRLAELERRHRRDRGRPLRIVLFSDHGCGRFDIHHATGFEHRLRHAGLRVVDHLAGPDDIVVPQFGVVNYGALFLRSADRAGVAAEAVVGHESVDVVAYASAPDVVEVLSHGGRARVRWTGSDSAARYRYEDLGGDPLRLTRHVEHLEATGSFDAEGYASRESWLRETAFGDFPDPLRRLGQALTGDRVTSRADVLISLGPTWAWGLRSAVLGSWVRRGRLKGTHGGLDRPSTLGMVLVNDAEFQMEPAIPADRALALFS